MLYTRHTKYGVYELKLIGDPNKLLEIPIKYFYGEFATLPVADKCSSMFTSNMCQLTDPEPEGVLS